MRFGEEPPDDVPPGFNEREDVIRSAMEYRQERARRGGTGSQGKQERANGGEDDGDVPMPVMVSGAEFAAEPLEARLFLDPDSRMLPMQHVVMLSGDGGTGKSLIAMQLALAVATGSRWIDLEVQTGPVVYVSAEDDRKELKQRQAEIAAAENIDANQAFSLYYLPMAGKDATLAYENKSGGQLQRTMFYRQVRKALSLLHPALLVIDNLADCFAGNENNRGLAMQFVQLLRELAIDFDCVVLLLAHPSLTGMASGSGMSGSTAWSNSVRSRLYLTKPDTPDEEATLRVLELMKSNYAPAGQRFCLRWEDGCFRVQAFARPFDHVSTRDLERVQEMFASGLWRVHEQSQDWGGYAVAGVLDLDVGRGINRKADRNTEQNHNRDDVRKILATWQRNKAIFMVDGLDARREPTKFYSNREQPA